MLVITLKMKYEGNYFYQPPQSQPQSINYNHNFYEIINLCFVKYQVQQKQTNAKCTYRTEYTTFCLGVQKLMNQSSSQSFYPCFSFVFNKNMKKEKLAMISHNVDLLHTQEDRAFGKTSKLM